MVILACFASFSCFKEAKLLCNAARAASEPAVSSLALDFSALISARWLTILVKVKSVGEVEANSSFLKSSEESVKSMSLLPIRSFYGPNQLDISHMQPHMVLLEWPPLQSETSLSLEMLSLHLGAHCRSISTGSPNLSLPSIPPLQLLHAARYRPAVVLQPL